MNGRILSRELQKIQNEQSFSSNRWWLNVYWKE
jgi:hypothetical protein